MTDDRPIPPFAFEDAEGPLRSNWQLVRCACGCGTALRISGFMLTEEDPPGKYYLWEHAPPEAIVPGEIAEQYGRGATLRNFRTFRRKEAQKPRRWFTPWTDGRRA